MAIDPKTGHARAVLPHRSDRAYVTDGGLETDLIFHHGVDLPHFAAFPLLENPAGRDLLRQYYDGYASIAARAGAALLLESPTWRANPDWGDLLGYSSVQLHDVNQSAIQFLQEIRQHYSADIDPILLSGAIGPRGDGYVSSGAIDSGEAADYHAPQVHALADAGADIVTAYTLTEPGEAIGIVKAARAADVPVAISFTVETDGRLPGGASLADAIDAVDASGGPDYFLVNCAHPSHMEPAFRAAGAWRERISGLRANASRKSHAELDEAAELDEGDPNELADEHHRLRTALPGLRIIGGCCGTDARHVAAIWGVDAPASAA